MPTATTYLKSQKRADKRTALQSLKDRFDYGLNPEKLGAVSSYCSVNICTTRKLP